MHTSSGCGFWVSWSHGCPRDVSPSWRRPGRGERGPLCLTLPPSWQGLPGSGAGVAAEGDGQQPADPAHLALPQRADRPLALAGQLLLPGPAGGHLPVRTATSTCHSTGTRLGTPTGVRWAHSHSLAEHSPPVQVRRTRLSMAPPRCPQCQPSLQLPSPSSLFPCRCFTSSSVPSVLLPVSSRLRHDQGLGKETPPCVREG